MATARHRTPALRPWRTYAHPRRSPATPAGKPGPAVHTVTGQLTSEPPTRRRCIRPTPDRVKGACGAPDRRDDAPRGRQWSAPPRGARRHPAHRGDRDTHHGDSV